MSEMGCPSLSGGREGSGNRGPRGAVFAGSRAQVAQFWVPESGPGRGAERQFSICQNAISASDSYICIYMNIFVINGSELRRWRIGENDVPP